MITEHPPEANSPLPERTPWATRILVPEMWATIAIAIMWLAVLFVGVFGPDMVFDSSTGGQSNVPVVVIVAFFALLATVRVARAGFRSRA